MVYFADSIYFLSTKTIQGVPSRFHSASVESHAFEGFDEKDIGGLPVSTRMLCKV